MISLRVRVPPLIQLGDVFQDKFRDLVKLLKVRRGIFCDNSSTIDNKNNEV